MLVPSGVTPPPIISAIEPVTTTAGRSGSSVRCARFMRLLGAVLAELLLGEARDDDRQFMRRQRVGVVQHRGHRQVLAADRAVDDHLQTLDRREDVHRAPVAAGPIVIEDEHQTISSALRSWPLRAPAGACTARGTPAVPRARPTRRRRIARSPTPAKNALISSKRALLPMAALTTWASEPAPAGAHQRPGRDQVGEVERRDRAAPWPVCTTGVVPMARSGSNSRTAAMSCSSDAR